MPCDYTIRSSPVGSFFFFFNDTATTEIYTLSLHDALPIYDRAARQREQQTVQQLDPPPVVVDERRQPPADPEVELHLWILGVRVVHEAALLVGHHLERQLVVVPEEEPPLAPGRDRRRVRVDVHDRPSLPEARL